MKRTLTKFYLLIICLILLSFKSDDSNIFYIEYKHKIVLKVVQKDSQNYVFTEVKKEAFTKVIDKFNNNKVFPKKANKETIEFYFAEGSKNSTILLMKNWTGYYIKFDTEIQNSENLEFKSVPNLGIQANSKSQETWLWKINKIRLSNFRIKK